jgi:hypothetical protein
MWQSRNVPARAASIVVLTMVGVASLAAATPAFAADGIVPLESSIDFGRMVVARVRTPSS